MKKLLLLLFLTTPLFAQIGNTTTQAFPGVPTGPCSGVTSYAINTAGQTLYICPGGTWHLISAGGGGSTFPVTGSTVDANDAGSATMSVDAHGSPAGTGDGNALASYYKGGLGSFSLPGFALGGGSGFKINTHSFNNLDWTWTDKANDYIGIKADATTSQAGLVVSSLGCYDFASSFNLSANAGMNVDTTICRTSPQVVNFGNATNTGTATATGLNVALPDGSNSVPSLTFASMPSGTGFVNKGGANLDVAWHDDTGSGVDIWGFNATNAPSLWVNEGVGGGFFGFSLGTPGAAVCSHCNVVSNGGLGSSTDGVNANAPYTATQFIQVSPCVSSVGTCGSASSGFVTIAAGATTVTVSTTAYKTATTCNTTANCSIVSIQEDSTKGTPLSVTCNTTVARSYQVTSGTNGTSFVITSSAAPSVNPACLSFKLN